MQIPYPYKSCNQDKQRIFGENDSQGREFREFEAINSIPAQFWKIPKKQYILQRIQHKKLFYFETPYFPYPPSEAAFVTKSGQSIYYSLFIIHYTQKYFTPTVSVKYLWEN